MQCGTSYDTDAWTLSCGTAQVRMLYSAALSHVRIWQADKKCMRSLASGCAPLSKALILESKAAPGFALGLLFAASERSSSAWQNSTQDSKPAPCTRPTSRLSGWLALVRKLQQAW
eukprot:1939033-Amphidinium_carterae.1